MSKTENNFTVGSISGGVAVGPSAQAAGAGGMIVNNAAIDLETVLKVVRSDIISAPTDKKAEIKRYLVEIEAEAAKPAPDPTRIATALKTIRSVCEGTVGSLIAAYLATL